MPKSPKTGKSPVRRAAAPRSNALVPVPPTEADIATRAYELFLQRGGGHGRDFDDWLAAERELQLQSAGV
jgi:hypothetical protein